MILELRDWLVVLSTLFSPIIAVQVTEYLNRRRQNREEQLKIFKTLMATRASTLDVHHVQALNIIDVVFSGKSARQEAVRRQWKQYLDHLNDKNYPVEHWETKRKELLVDLLDTMGQHLGFDFDKTHIKNQSYFPQGYGNLENEHSELRRALIDITTGKRPCLCEWQIYPIKSNKNSSRVGWARLYRAHRQLTTFFLNSLLCQFDSSHAPAWERNFDAPASLTKSVLLHLSFKPPVVPISHDFPAGEALTASSATSTQRGQHLLLWSP